MFILIPIGAMTWESGFGASDAQLKELWKLMKNDQPCALVIDGREHVLYTQKKPYESPSLTTKSELRKAVKSMR